MLKLRWAVLVAMAAVLSGCPKNLTYKPYLPEEYRGEPGDADPTLRGVLTGRSGKYVIY